jgi:hypothetical protein
MAAALMVSGMSTMKTTSWSPNAIQAPTSLPPRLSMDLRTTSERFCGFFTNAANASDVYDA